MWHGFRFDVGTQHPDAWTHAVAGDGIDAGSTYAYRWTPLTHETLLRFEPRFRPLLRLLMHDLARPA